MGFISIPCPAFCHMFSFSLEIIGRQLQWQYSFLIGGPNSVFRPLHRAPGAQPSPHIPGVRTEGTKHLQKWPIPCLFQKLDAWWSAPRKHLKLVRCEMEGLWKDCRGQGKKNMWKLMFKKTILKTHSTIEIVCRKFSNNVSVSRNFGAPKIS